MDGAPALRVLLALKRLGDHYVGLRSSLGRSHTRPMDPIDAMHLSTAMRLLMDRAIVDCLDEIERVRAKDKDSLLVSVVEHAVGRIQRQSGALVRLFELQHTRPPETT